MCGDLTKEWRAANPDVESAEVLVAKIKADLDNIKKKKNPEIFSQPYILPSNWIWIRFEQITNEIKKINPLDNPKEKICYIDIASIDNHQFKIVAYKEYSGEDAPSRARQLIKENDILFS
jgi:hypothetical protein